MSHIVFLAAVFTGIIPVISAYVLSSTNVLGLRTGALVSALILFTIPLALLAMAGPFVIKMASSTLEGIGSVVGSVYAVSTLGSVAGTLLLGFYLLPLLGTRIIVLAVSTVLIMLAISLTIFECKRLRYPTSPGLWVVSCATAFLVLGVASQVGGRNPVKDYKLLSEAESHYGWVRVIDQPKEGLRWLLSDSSTIGVSSLDTGNGLLSYQQIVAEV
ncbi:MAG: fused MFS/spermidine synthase, partial [Methyloprofundus sp.]|nr:fused MFS/spermidine synthase [Methyloprofundus sp.]